MRGLEIAEKYYREYGAAAIHENFSELESVIAVGLAGSGSECYGFDDETSRDHDFEPGFCIWIPEEEEIDLRTAFKLERMYAKLPSEYMGLVKSPVSPAGGNRRGVIRFSEFLERHIGRKDTNLTLNDWFSIPECSLSEVVNGCVWRDDSGQFTDIRQQIGTMPEDVRLKKLAASLYIMGQSGNYNYSRCISHGEKGAAQLSVSEFVRHTMHAVFLINHKYMPYYKWSFRAMRNLAHLSEIGDGLEYLLNTGNDTGNIDIKKQVIVNCTESVMGWICRNELSITDEHDPGNLALIVNNRISDNYIRNADILSGVGAI